MICVVPALGVAGPPVGFAQDQGPGWWAQIPKALAESGPGRDGDSRNDADDVGRDDNDDDDDHRDDNHDRGNRNSGHSGGGSQNDNLLPNWSDLLRDGEQTRRA